MVLLVLYMHYIAEVHLRKPNLRANYPSAQVNLYLEYGGSRYF